MLFCFYSLFLIKSKPFSPPLNKHTPQTQTFLHLSLSSFLLLSYIMEAALLRHHRPAVGLPRLRRNPTRKPNCFLTVRAVLTSRPTDRHETSVKIVPEKSTYNDNWYDRMAINYLSQSFQTTTGVKNIKTGYDSLVDAASVVSKKFRTNEQQELVVQTLTNAIPQPILATIKGLLPPSKFAREYFAVFTTIFFAWLIGPCEVKASEIDGRIEKNIVNIPKCRFLDETRCVGMCVNLCKMPSQKFIKDSLGMPLNMVPNFEDMSCQMIFGQEPPAQSDDPALKQPCYKLLCKSKQKHTSDCSS